VPFAKAGCLGQLLIGAVSVVVAVVLAVLIALAIYHFTNPPKPARAPASIRLVWSPISSALSAQSAAAWR